MEPHRVSTSPSVPAAPVQRSKAPAPTRADEGAADDPATTGGFSSLLSALGDGAVQEVLQPDAVFPAGGDNVAALRAWQGPDAWPPLPSAAAQGGRLATLSLADAAQRAGLLGAELLGQGGLVAQTAKIDTAVELPAAQGPGIAVAGYQRAFARLQNVLLQGVPAGPGVAAQAPGHQSVGTGRQGAPVSLAAPTALAAAPEGPQVAVAAAQHAPADVSASALLAQWWAAEPAARSAAAPVATEYGSGAVALGGSGQGAPGEPGLDVAPAAPETPAAGTEDAVTEQASYWVSENLQNAELTVTHDGMPVQVSVSLSGKEAHVAFRSDESQTRDLLDASQNQLRDMLGNEGLVLSGVSVGESGARQASGEGAAPLRGRASGRVGVQVRVSEGAADARSRPGVLTDRAVDVFV